MRSAASPISSRRRTTAVNRVAKTDRNSRRAPRKALAGPALQFDTARVLRKALAGPALQFDTARVLRKALAGPVMSADLRAALGQAMAGATISTDVQASIRQAMAGRSMSPELRAAVRGASAGTRMSVELRAALLRSFADLAQPEQAGRADDVEGLRLADVDDDPTRAGFLIAAVLLVLWDDLFAELLGDAASAAEVLFAWADTVLNRPGPVRGVASVIAIMAAVMTIAQGGQR